jgi:hypothetical protein
MRKKLKVWKRRGVWHPDMDVITREPHPRDYYDVLGEIELDGGGENPTIGVAKHPGLCRAGASLGRRLGKKEKAVEITVKWR